MPTLPLHILKAPEKISNEYMLRCTYYDKMSNEDREKVFEAYRFNSRTRNYELFDEAKINNSIKVKLVGTSG